MGRAVLQYSHCTSDTASRLSVRGAQVRRVGHAGRKQALGRWAARALGAATRQLGLRHDRGARPRHDQTRPRHGRTRAAMRGLGVACAYLGVLLGCGLCTWCTQPVFDPV